MNRPWRENTEAIFLLQMEPFFKTMPEIAEMTDAQILELFRIAKERQDRAEGKDGGTFSSAMSAEDEPKTKEEAWDKFWLCVSMLGENNEERAREAFERQWKAAHPEG